MSTLTHPALRVQRLMFALTVIFAIVFAGIPVRSSRAAQALPTAEIDGTVTQLMARYDVPGVALAIVQDGAIAYIKGYGLRDTTTGAKVDDQTAFGLGSVTKSITALGVQLLVEEGKLDLDRPIITYVPDLKLSDAAAQNALTLRQLLSHTSGLSPQDTGSAVLIANVVSRADYLKALETLPLVNQPGKSFAYANQNFALAGLVIERVTGQTWEDFTRDRIFRPLGMVNTSYDADGLKNSANAAAPHDIDVLKGMIPVGYTQNLSAIGPAASVNASIRDMAAYALFQLTGQTSAGTLTLAAKRLAEMHSPAIKISAPSESGDASLTTDAGYGLGWFTERYRGLSNVQHGGNIIGYSSSVTLVPEKKLGIVLLSDANYANVFLEAVRLRILELTLGLAAERDIAADLDKQSGFDPVAYQTRLSQAKTCRADPADLKALTGDYSGASGSVTVTERDGRLYLKFAASGNVIALIPYIKDAFIANTFPYRGARMTFITDANGTRIRLGDPKDGPELAVRAAAGITTKVVADAKGRFRFTIPASLTMQTFGDLIVVVQPAPQLIVVAAAYPATNADLLADYEAFNRTFDPNFKDKPLSTTASTVNGRTWTVYEYALPSNQISISYVVRQGDVNYTFSYACGKADLDRLMPTITAMLDSFTIG